MSKRILVVEDHEDNRQILRDLLGNAGYQMIEAETGEAGLAAAAAHKPDLILMDIQLPGLDGYGVATELRRDYRTAKARMIAVTGYGTDADRRKSREAGFEQHMVKPVDPAALERVLANLEVPGAA